MTAVLMEGNLANPPRTQIVAYSCTGPSMDSDQQLVLFVCSAVDTENSQKKEKKHRVGLHIQQGALGVSESCNEVTVLLKVFMWTTDSDWIWRLKILILTYHPLNDFICLTTPSDPESEQLYCTLQKIKKCMFAAKCAFCYLTKISLKGKKRCLHINQK